MTFHSQGGVKLVKKGKQLLQQLLAQGALTGLMFGLLPIQVAAQTEHQSTLLAYQFNPARLTLETRPAEPIVLADLEGPSITIGESRHQEEQRRLQEARTKHRVSTKTESVVRVDPDLATKRDLVKRAAETYQIPWEILEAVWQVESGKAWDTHVRSSAGAQGPAQFMPATWRRYGVDGNADGQKNIHSAEDAVFGAAHYLAANGAADGQIRRALLAYNHTNWYVEKVLNVAETIGYEN